MIELRLSRELARWLGAVTPTTVNHFRELRDRGDMMLRDRIGFPLFWQWQLTRDEIIKASSGT